MLNIKRFIAFADRYCIGRVFALSVRGVDCVYRSVNPYANIPNLPVSARSEVLMILLRPCEAVIRVIATGVSPCDSRGLH